MGLLNVSVAPVNGGDARDVGGVAARDELGVGGDGGRGGEERDCFFVFSCGFEREAEVEIGRKEMALVGFFCSWFLAISRLLRPILKKLES